MAGDAIPNIVLTHPTPPRFPTSHRLLFRGGLALPDSDIILHGIAFIAHVPQSSPASLFQSDISLALETMRGRPTLAFVSIVNVSELLVDGSGNISMYIHPAARLTRSFFEHLFCTHVMQGGRTEKGVRIRLSDAVSDTDDADMVIFGQPPDSPGLPLRISLARVIPDRLAAEQAKPKAPRPDDPLPRLHPFANLNGGNRRRPKRSREDDEPTQKKRKVPLVDEQSSEIFRLPALPPPRLIPARLNGVVENYSKQATDTPTQKQSSRNQAGVKDKASVEDGSTVLLVDNESALVASNKMIIKKEAVLVLANRGVPKDHSDFRETWNATTRGVCFALRSKMSGAKLDKELVTRLVQAHVDMYIGGQGGACNLESPS